MSSRVVDHGLAELSSGGSILNRGPDAVVAIFWARVQGMCVLMYGIVGYWRLIYVYLPIYEYVVEWRVSESD